MDDSNPSEWNCPADISCIWYKTGCFYNSPHSANGDQSPALGKVTGYYKKLNKAKKRFAHSKEKYKADHAAELKQFYETHRKLSAQGPDGKFDRHKLDAEYARLEQEHEETYAQFKSIRADSQQLWKIKSCVDSARKNREQAQQQNHRKQEQEI